MTAQAAGAAALADRIAAYLRDKLPAAHDLTVNGLYRIPGGASRETWSFDAAWREAGTDQRRGFILRRDPDAGLLDTDRDVEYSVYRAFAPTPVPVPQVYWLELDAAPLQRPFFIMERLDGLQSDGMLLAARPEEDRRRIGRQKFEILAAIHKQDPADLGLLRLAKPRPPLPEECALRELRHWEGIINAQQLEPLPVIRLALAWLRSHLPSPAQRVVVCHGDYRTGNFLYDQGEIRCVLDWEMVHLGDPIEDLAWTMLENWRFGPQHAIGNRNPLGLVGGLLPEAEAIAIYEAAGGINVDPADLRWWTVFSHVKAVGIWITGGRSFAEGRTSEPLMALIPRLLNAQQFAGILDLLGW